MYGTFDTGTCGPIRVLGTRTVRTFLHDRYIQYLSISTTVYAEQENRRRREWSELANMLTPISMQLTVL
eukprot:COSAG02_NODE_4559_length_5216_cov_2.212038_1_plen_69_part_00